MSVCLSGFILSGGPGRLTEGKWNLHLFSHLAQLDCRGQSFAYKLDTLKEIFLLFRVCSFDHVRQTDRQTGRGEVCFYSIHSNSDSQ